jgi:hypothetical protein
MASCGGLGTVYVRPAEMLQVGRSVTLAFLFCRRCVPSWQIDQVQLDQPPWSATRLGPDDRFRCPACRGRVDWHIHGPAWRPTCGSATSSAVTIYSRQIAPLIREADAMRGLPYPD